MATVIFGAIGAGIGAVASGGNPEAIRWGWAAGTVVGSWLNPAGGGEYGRLSDRKISGSQYGAGIPMVWGKVRVGGTLIWADQDASGNHLVEHEDSQGGKGGPSQTSYYYSATVAVAFAIGELVFPDGTTVKRNVTLKKLWANDQLVYDSADPTGGILKPTDDFVFYDGDESQAPSSIIVTRDGTSSGNTVAFPGVAYVVFEDLNLRDYGNSVPSFSAILETDAVDVGDVFSDLARLCGITTGQIDVTLATAAVGGMAVTDPTAPSEVIGTLLDFYEVDLIEVDGQLKLIPRGGASVATITADDLGVNGGPRLKRTREQDSETPGSVELQYFDLATDLQGATQVELNQTGDSLNMRSISVPLSLSAADAKAKVQREVDKVQAALQPAMISSLPKWGWLAPADVVTVLGKRYRVGKMTGGVASGLDFELDPERSSSFSQSGSGGTSGGGQDPVSVEPVPSVFTCWSGWEIRDADQSSAGFYVAATGADGWRGGRVFYTQDGTTWISGPNATRRSTFGVTTSALSASGAAADTFDNTNTFDVDVSASSGVINTVSDDAILAGQNHARVGSEILGVGTAAVGSPFNYTLSHLRRGERGSTIGASSGVPFVLLDNVVRVNVPEEWVGETISVKVVSPYQTLADVTAQTVVIQARNVPVSEQLIDFALAYSALAVTVVDSYAGGGTRTAVGWTTYDASAVLPAGTQFVELQAVANDRGNATTRQAIEARKDSGGTVYAVSEGRIDNADSDLHLCSTIRVPVTTSRQFDYRVLIGFEDGWELRIVGAWKTIS
jgi:hypothetical protein